MQDRAAAYAPPASAAYTNGNLAEILLCFCISSNLRGVGLLRQLLRNIVGPDTTYQTPKSAW